jgi:hypothetical protein
MTLADFAEKKNAAKRAFGPGKLICYISAEALAMLEHETDHGHYIPDQQPEELHSDIIFRIQPYGPMRFGLLDESGPYVDNL